MRLKKLSENFTNLVQVGNLQIHEAQWTLNQINTKQATPRYIIIKPLKTKDRKISKSSREKWCIPCRRIILTVNFSDFSSEIMEPEETVTFFFKC